MSLSTPEKSQLSSYIGTWVRINVGTIKDVGTILQADPEETEYKIQEIALLLHFPKSILVLNKDQVFNNEKFIRTTSFLENNTRGFKMKPYLIESDNPGSSKKIEGVLELIISKNQLSSKNIEDFSNSVKPQAIFRQIGQVPLLPADLSEIPSLEEMIGK